MSGAAEAGEKSSPGTSSSATQEATTTVPWSRVQPHGRKLAIMWAVTVIFGGFAIFTLPSTGVLRLLVPILLLGLYGLYGYRYVNSAGGLVTLRHARVGQLADSLYFLGFLWTLVALIDSFVIHQVSIAEAVFRAFGYALVTTATGMFLRLLLLQFGYSAEEQAHSGEVTIEEQISRFTNEVSRAVDKIRSFHDNTDAALTGWIDSLNKSSASLRASVDDVRSQTADLGAALSRIHEENATRVGQLVESTLGRLIEGLTPSLEGLHNANSNFIMEVNASSAKVRNTVDAGVNKIQNAVDSGSRSIQSELSTGAHAIRANFVDSTHEIKVATSGFGEMVFRQTEELESRIGGLSKKIEEIRVPADIVEKTVADQTSNVNTRLVESTNAFQGAIEKLSKQIREIRVPPEIVEENLARQLDRINARLNESATAFHLTIERLSKQIAGVRVSPDIVEKTVSQQVTRVSASLVVSTNELNTAIKQLERSVLSVRERVGTIGGRRWWEFWK